MTVKVLGMPLGLQRPVTAREFLRGAGLNSVLAAGSGLLAAQLFLPREWWWLGGVCLVPLLLALRRTSEVRAAVWLTLLYALVFFATALPWITAIFGPSSLGIFLIMGLPLVLFGLGYRLAAGRWRPWALALWAPVLWVAVEWVRCEGWYFQFSWAQFGFSLIATPNGGALYPVLGVYGVTFLLVLVNALLVELFCRPLSWGRRGAALAVLLLALVPLVATLHAPGKRHAVAPKAPGALRVALVQDETGGVDTLKQLTLAERAFAPQLIVWPEYAVPTYPLDYDWAMEELADVARQMKATLVLGTKEHAPETARVDLLRRRSMLLAGGELFYNSAFILSPDGTRLGTYHKTHPIQFFADGVPGRAFPTFATPAGRLGVGICYDFDYALTALRLTRAGAEVLCVPTFDAAHWTDLQHNQHARMARTRAAEVGRWVVRTTSSGFSQVIDPQGREVATIANGASTTATATVERLSERTPYVRATFLLPYLCLLLAALGMAVEIGRGVVEWRRRRAVHKGHEKS